MSNAIIRTADRVLKRLPPAAKSIPKGDWLPCCLVPAWRVLQATEGSNVPMIDALSAQTLLSWRASPNTYRFDADLYREITGTNLSGVAIPPDALYHLPHYGVFIETQGFEGDLGTIGFFASLSDDSAIDGYGVELRFVFVTHNGRQLLPLPLPLTGGTIADCIAALKGMDIYHVFGSDLDTVAADIAHCISLLLYLCSDEPDSAAPLPRPNTRRDKQQQIILPPLAPREWYIGAKFGAAYRQAAGNNERQKSGTRHAVRPHIRRAHWHGYWHGKRTAKHRDYKLKWLPPVMVAVDDVQDLPVVVHPVNKLSNK